jgi:integrase
MIEKRVTAAGEARYLVRLFRGRDSLTGKKRYLFETLPTKKEAQRWERETKVSLEHGTYVAPSKQTVGDYLTAWLDGPARLTVRERTMTGYRELIQRYVTGHRIALVALSNLSGCDLEAFYAELSARGLGPRTVRMVHAPLHRALAKAVKTLRLKANPAAGVELPQQEDREMHALTADQKSRLLATSEATGNRWHALWHVLANGGLRPCEALGLRWQDVGADRVHIAFALVPKRTGGGWTLERPKTRQSVRTVTLSGATIEALAWHKAQQEIEKETAGAAYRDHGFVFAGQHGAPGNLANLTVRHFKSLLTAYYRLPKIRLYDLRHTHASLLLSAGVPVHIVSARLGHASAKMTLDVYAHVLSGQDEDAVAKLEAFERAGV